jgi:hypothetical protein
VLEGRVIDEEWPRVRARFEGRLRTFGAEDSA